MTSKPKSAPPADTLDRDMLWQQQVMKGLRSLYVVAVESRDALRSIELLLGELADLPQKSPLSHQQRAP